MDKSDGVAFRCLLVAIVLLGAAVHEAGAVTCNPEQLSSCEEAITGSQSPSAECCQTLKAQEFCLCEYLQNSTYRAYLDSPNAKKVAADCGVSIPNC
ncbi:non-specific lipid-transfer protein 2-like [Dorcoceras hygrometricum]|uniref:Non-specific lipid-transfer protein 2-like n=1 Tax=Dorcoceras hygrometricum TaxID=472368 RepID=A0A2Z7CHY6_9LAMI|nr:non-specific lipid-transfer protein 2-like [Dorcoceras hygrometricum]